MRTLQIRNLPEDVYEALSFRARSAHRSLAQQAIVELRGVKEQQRKKQREDVLSILRRQIQEGIQQVEPLPEDLVREDRES